MAGERSRATVAGERSRTTVAGERSRSATPAPEASMASLAADPSAAAPAAGPGTASGAEGDNGEGRSSAESSHLWEHVAAGLGCLGAAVAQGLLSREDIRQVGGWGQKLGAAAGRLQHWTPHAICWMLAPAGHCRLRPSAAAGGCRPRARRLADAGPEPPRCRSCCTGRLCGGGHRAGPAPRPSVLRLHAAVPPGMHAGERARCPATFAYCSPGPNTSAALAMLQGTTASEMLAAVQQARMSTRSRVELLEEEVGRRRVGCTAALRCTALQERCDVLSRHSPPASCLCARPVGPCGPQGAGRAARHRARVP